MGTTIEIWININGYPDYMVSTFGRVKSLSRWLPGKPGVTQFKRFRWKSVSIARDFLSLKGLVKPFARPDDEQIKVKPDFVLPPDTDQKHN